MNFFINFLNDCVVLFQRLLTCEFIFQYKADIDGPNGEVKIFRNIFINTRGLIPYINVLQQYERRCRLPLAVSIVPAVTVAAWHVLPGDGPTTRYVVVDVTNSTEWDAELTYGKGKVIGVQPRESCRLIISVESVCMMSACDEIAES